MRRRSSKTSLLRALVAVTSVCALSGSAHVPARDGAGEPTAVGKTQLPFLAVQVKRGAHVTSADTPDWSRAFAYVLTNATAADRVELAARLETYRSRLEATVNPLMEDLEDGTPRDVMTAWAKRHGPLLQAALALATPTVSLADGSAEVTDVPGCDAQPCFPAWGTDGDEAEDATERHARFAAWPVAAAVIVRVIDGGERRCALRELRTRVPRLDADRTVAQDTGVIALVVAGDEEEPVRADEQALIDRVVRLEGAHRVQQARAHGTSATTAAMTAKAFPLALEPTDLLVVPRLRALATWSDFRDATRAAIAGCSPRAEILAPRTFP